MGDNFCDNRCMTDANGSTQEQGPITLYVVVCTSFHSAIGPYLDPLVALEVARDLNGRRDGCRYVPVAMPLPDGQVATMAPDSADPASTREYRPGGYL